jgi:cytochrome c oxidase subunit IV
MAQATGHAPAQPAAHAAAHEEAQQHPIKLYLVVWGWLFLLSLFSSSSIFSTCRAC